MTDQLLQHRAAYQAVMAVLPGSEYLSHEINLEPGWDVPEVYVPIPVLALPLGCQTCGDQLADVPLTKKCEDLHERCRCGARYDQPKNPGCRRRKHPKAES